MASVVDVAIWAAKAGWRGTDLTTAVAVAWATSAGDTARPGGLYGLGNQGDGQAQSNVAYAKWKAGGWGGFASHRNNRYLLVYPMAVSAVASAPVVNAVQNPEQIVEGVKDLAKQLPGADMLDMAKNALTIVYKASAWVGNPDNWSRVLLVVLGGGMVLGGISVAAGGTVLGGITGKVGKLAGKTTSTVSKVAKSTGGKK